MKSGHHLDCSGQVVQINTNAATVWIDERANHAKTRFLAGVSEVRATLLHATRLFIHWLVQVESDRTQCETVAHIDTSLSSGERLLSGLLVIARLEAGGMPMERRTFATAELLMRRLRIGSNPIV